MIKAGREVFADLPAEVEISDEAGVHRCTAEGRRRVYAPHGLSDVFDLVVRPNPVRAPRSVYEAKAARRSGRWPELTVLDRPRRDSSMERP